MIFNPKPPGVLHFVLFCFCELVILALLSLTKRVVLPVCIVHVEVYVLSAAAACEL